MKLYHYTSIETLALILDSHQILFNRLDNGVDDLEETESQTPELKIANKCFVSCWTHNPTESVALWKLYTNNGLGVRIELEHNMFDDSSESTFNFNIVIPGEYQSTCCRFPAYPNGNLKLCEVNYVDTPATHRMKGWKRGENNKTIEMNISVLAATKNEIWSFQKESRFVILGFPIAHTTPKTIDINNFGEIANNNGESIKQILINLSSNAFANLRITLGPMCLESHRLIVEALVQRAGLPLNIIKESSLKGKVRFK